MGAVSGTIEKPDPILSLWVMASPERVKILRTHHGPIPQPVEVRALIDTGASCSVVDIHVLHGLGLLPTGATPVHTASREEERDAYDVSLILREGEADSKQFTVSAVGAELSRSGILALVGWDVLASCDLVCKGPARKFTLRF